MCDPNEIPCKQKPCLPPAPRDPSDNQKNPNDVLKGRPVLYTGVVWIGIVRRFLIPRTCCVVEKPSDAQLPPTEASGPGPRQVAHVQDEDSALHEPPLRYKQRPLPLPLVTEQLDVTGDPKAALLRRQGAGAAAGAAEGDAASPLRALVVQVGEASAAAVTQAKVITEDLGAILRDGQETTAEVIETVRSEDGRRLRLAVISAGGVLGYLAGLKRGGTVTRLVYSATGATATATVCFPEETKVYNRRGLATVRRWMLLGLSLVYSGPQKPLGSGDMRIIDPRIVISEETISSRGPEDRNNSLKGENLIEHLRENLGSFGYYVEKLKAKLSESSSMEEENESIEDAIIGSELPRGLEGTSQASTENFSPLKSDRFENLSSKNDSEAARDLSPSPVPFSPALPVPPKLNSSRHKINIIPIKPEEDLNKTNNLEETPPLRRNKSRDYFHLQESDEVSSGNEADDEDDNDYEEGQQEDVMDSENTFVIPTGGLEEKLMDGRQEDGLQKTGHKKNQCPLNKKLVAFYRNMPEEEKTSREKGYDDAYSNRGK